MTWALPLNFWLLFIFSTQASTEVARPFGSSFSLPALRACRRVTLSFGAFLAAFFGRAFFLVFFFEGDPFEGREPEVPFPPTLRNDFVI